eukprot:CAMPEP_0202725828 /NCGR_PEP_ID=MMETSP1385-20130828/184300_1 /ASSEMBLY_ACC=CAM_ASM_000861 /TAXON_ID=933848 /ORGANISM="Elphidium margaritaceum" /LENGTH=476 /DNA_ID=CAMNT_0049392033 /DNA_START=53 /DNA_END=1483 /DNA_ORIENTATION=+
MMVLVFSLLVAIAYGWTEELALSVSGGVFSYDIGESEFNEKFWASAGVIKRECSTCGAPHQTIYYKRLTDLKTWAAWSYFRVTWASNNNILGANFELYSSIEDLEAGTNAWTYCNYDDTNIGPFRDCGPTGYVAFEWTSNGRGGDTADYYILTDCADEDCDDGDICNGEEFCLDGSCTSGDELSCPADFVCSSSQQRCVRDCETFAIDGYLRDCSEEWDSSQVEMVAVINQASDNLESIAALQPLVAANTATLDTVATNVDEVNAVIGGERISWSESDTILDQLAALNARVTDIDALLLRMDAVESRLDSESIAALQPLVAANTATLDTVATNVDEVNAVIGGERISWSESDTILDQLAALNARVTDIDALLLRMDAVESRLDSIEERLFGFAPQTAEGENADNSFTSPAETASAPVVTINGYEVHWMGVFTALTVLLLAVNVVLFAQNCCCRRKKKEYRAVYADSDDQVEAGLKN